MECCPPRVPVEVHPQYRSVMLSSMSECLAKLREGANVWNRWRADHPTVIPHLQRVALFRPDLRGMNLRGFRSSHLGLCHADFRGADLRGAEFSESDLS